MENTNKSEVARIRKQIELEYQASQRVLTGFTPTAKHQYIIKRQENIGACFEELRKLMPPEEAIAIVIEVLDSLHTSRSLSGNFVMIQQASVDDLPTLPIKRIPKS